MHSGNKLYNKGKINYVSVHLGNTLDRTKNKLGFYALG